MFKVSTQLSYHCHILRRTIPSTARIFSTTYKTQKTPRSASEKESDRRVPSKDDINATSKESTRSGTNDEVAHTDEAAYGKVTNPVEEKATADAEGTSKSGGPLDYSPAIPQISHQGKEDKSPDRGQKGPKKTSGGSKNAT